LEMASAGPPSVPEFTEAPQAPVEHSKPDAYIVHGFIIEEIACANLLFEGLGNLPPGGFQIEEGQVEQTIPGTTLGTTLVDQTPSHFK